MRPRRRPRLLYFLGPGVAAATAGLEASNLGVFAYVGSRYGFALVWSVVLSMLLFSVLQQAAAVAASRPRAPAWWWRLVEWSTYTANIATATINAVMVALMVSLLTGTGWWVGLSLATLASWSLAMGFRGVRSVERILVVLSLPFLAYVAVMVIHMWGEPSSIDALASGFRVRLSAGQVPDLVAVFGAAAAPYSLVLQAEAVRARRMSGERLAWEMVDVAFGTLFSILVGVAVAYTAAVYLNGRGLVVEGVDALVELLGPYAGRATAFVVGVAAVSAGILAILAIVAANAMMAGARPLGVGGRYRDIAFYTIVSSSVLAAATLAAKGPLGFGEAARAASIAINLTVWPLALVVASSYLGMEPRPPLPARIAVAAAGVAPLLVNMALLYWALF